MIAGRLIFAIVVLGSAGASADPHSADPHNVPSSDPNPDPHSRISLLAGLATPTGELGFEFTFIRRYFEVGAAAGVGILGPQLSIMPRLRLNDRGAEFTLGAGVSGGPYNDPVFLCLSEEPGRCDDTKATVLWANGELGVAIRAPSGATLRLYGGAGKLVAHSDCKGPKCSGVDGQTMPYLGVALGYSF